MIFRLCFRTVRVQKIIEKAEISCKFQMKPGLRSKFLEKLLLITIFAKLQKFLTIFLSILGFGMALAWPYDLEFFLIYFKFIFRPIFELKIHAKKLLDNKKFHFRSQIFINQQYLTPPAWEFNLKKLVVEIKFLKQEN